MEKDVMNRIYSKWCALKNTGAYVPPFTLFVEQEKNNQEYVTKSKVVFSSHPSRDVMDHE